jgi:CubicO group peptidase (beta-lactamase class C family)
MKAEGIVEPRFAPVRDEFERNFAERGEVGAALCVYHQGRPVIDIWGGMADPSVDRPWTSETTCRIDSTTKALTAICAHMLVEQGELDLEAPIAEYWPEFAAEGKGEIPVRLALSHQLGLPSIDRWLTLDDMEAWTPLIETLQNQRPYWKPGTAHGYHAFTFGWIVGELIRRVSGMSVGEFLGKHVTGPLGADLWIGTPESEQARIAPVIVTAFEPAPPEDGRSVYPLDLEMWNEFIRRMSEIMVDPPQNTPDLYDKPLTLLQRISAGDVGFEELNTPRALSMEIPAANGTGTARSHAKVYAALLGEIDSVRLLSPSAVDRALQRQAIGPDLVMFVTTAWGLGFLVNGGSHFLGLGERNFGHLGANGTTVFADPDRDLTFAYTRNAMIYALRDKRTEPLIRSVYDCVGG